MPPWAEAPRLPSGHRYAMKTRRANIGPSPCEDPRSYDAVKTERVGVLSGDSPTPDCRLS